MWILFLNIIFFLCRWDYLYERLIVSEITAFSPCEVSLQIWKIRIILPVCILREAQQLAHNLWIFLKLKVLCHFIFACPIGDFNYSWYGYNSFKLEFHKNHEVGDGHRMKKYIHVCHWTLHNTIAYIKTSLLLEWYNKLHI